MLIYEVYTQASFDRVSPAWKQYREAFHTSTRQLAKIANKAKPDLLILYHRATPVVTRRAHKSAVKRVAKSKC